MEETPGSFLAVSQQHYGELQRAEPMTKEKLLAIRDIVAERQECICLVELYKQEKGPAPPPTTHLPALRTDW